jgi:ribosome-binding factor A
MRDPRLNFLIGISKVRTSCNLETCIVKISVIDNSVSDEEKYKLIRILNKAKGYIRTLVAKEINLRVTPEFKFILDDSAEYSQKINDLLKVCL